MSIVFTVLIGLQIIVMATTFGAAIATIILDERKPSLCEHLRYKRWQ